MSEHYEPASSNEKELSPEQREALQQDAAQEMGELATELVILAPEEGEPNAKETYEQGKGEYDRRIESVVDAVADEMQQAARYLSGHIEDAVVQMAAGKRNLSDAEDTLRSAVRYAEEGSGDSLRRLLQDAGDTVQSALRQYSAAANEAGSLHRYAAQKTEDTREGTAQIRTTDAAFEDFIRNTEADFPGQQVMDKPFEGSREIVTALHKASDSLEEVSLKFAQASRTGDEQLVDIRASLNIIDALATDAAAGRLNVDDVRRVITRLNGVQSDGALRETLTAANDTIDDVRQAVVSLTQ